jgi:hypothetical protein
MTPSAFLKTSAARRFKVMGLNVQKGVTCNACLNGRVKTVSVSYLVALAYLIPKSRDLIIHVDSNFYFKMLD